LTKNLIYAIKELSQRVLWLCPKGRYSTLTQLRKKLRKRGNMEKLVSFNDAFLDAQKNQEKRVALKDLPQFNAALPVLTEESREEAKRQFQAIDRWANGAAERVLDIQDRLKEIMKVRGWEFVRSLVEKKLSLEKELERINGVDERIRRILEERIRSMAKEREREKMKTLLSRQNEFLQPEKLKEDAPTGSYLFHAPYKRGEGGRVQLEGAFVLRLEETPKGKVLIPLEGYGCFRWVGQPPGHCFLPLRSALNGWISSAPAGQLGEFLRKLARTVGYFIRKETPSSDEEQGS
jgi:hypothetical protein